ncbi:MAG: glutamine amidotransferase [Fuerstiella sp.]
MRCAGYHTPRVGDDGAGFYNADLLKRQPVFGIADLPPGVLRDMRLAIEPVWPWPLLLLAAIVMLVVIAGSYPRRTDHLPAGWRRTLLALRIFLVGMLMFWLLRPVVVIESDDRSDAVLYVLLDGSGSMGTPDGPGGQPRYDELKTLFDRAQPLLEELSDEVEVRIRNLADQLTPIESPAEQADGPRTAIGAGLDELARESGTENIAAVLLWSDGRQAATGAADVDPLLAARLLGRQHEPVYTVPFGTTDVSTSTTDVAVSELDIARDVFIRNVVPVRVRLKAFGAENRDIKVRVLVEQRSGVGIGESGTMAAVPPSVENRTLEVHRVESASDDVELQLQFVPTESGEIKVAVEAEPINGEVRLTNNRVETIVRVRSGGIRVAYFDRIRPELKWLKRINVSSRVQLDVQPILGGRFADRNQFNEDWFEPGNYDAFIIGDVPAEVFGEVRLRRLFQCCEAGAGLMMTGGESAFGGGGYHATPLALLLPVAMTPNDQHLTGDVPMNPTNAARRDPILQIAPPDQNSTRWSNLAPLRGANVLKLKEGSAARVLAENKTGLPLLIAQNIGSARVLAFAGDTTWQWALQEDWAEEAHQRFWRQVIFWLTKMDNDGESAAWIDVQPRDLNPGSIASMTFGLRDESGSPVPDATMKVTVTPPEGTPEDIAVRDEGGTGAGEFAETSVSGDYWAQLLATAPDGSNNVAVTRFLVNQRDPELDNPAADPALLREIAHVSGGDFLDAEAMIARLQDWVDNGMPSLELRRSERVSLWDNWFSLLLFVAVLCTEWALRKKRGLV